MENNAGHAVTEAEWLAANDPMAMLAALQASGKISERKLRLLACAGHRLIPTDMYYHPGEDVEAGTVVEVVERFADGLATEDEFQAARTCRCDPDEGTWFVANPSAAAAAYDIVSSGRQRRQTASLVALLRDIFGPHPFREVCLDPGRQAWSGGTAVGLAQAAYEDRQLPSGHLATARLAVLADAFEEAGCTDNSLLGHLCKQGGVHVRGCWAVDLLLGKG